MWPQRIQGLVMNELNRCIFSGMQILKDRQWVKEQAVIVEDNLIKAIIQEEMITHHLPARRYDFPDDHYLVPGLIDLHVHGTHGKDVMDGTEEALNTISRALVVEGVTGFLATTLTADVKRIETVLKVVSEASPNLLGAALLGVHLEGPFIAKSKAGAQSVEEIQAPNSELMHYWQNLAKGAIKIVTLAPELPGALALIKGLRNMNVIAAIGHTNATYAETWTAIAAGCTQATHLFNAMHGISQREPGAVGALLLAPDVVAEIIVDGVHLHPAIVELIWRLKGKDNLLLVTDAMRAKCLGDGEYDLGGQTVKAVNGKVFLADGTLAGSTLRMPQAIKNMVHFSKCSLIDAVEMASYNPAHILGLHRRKGSITIGKDADLIVLNADFDVKLTMREGREIFRC
jgi:N-acetylglucosamine-6-phosphate deacetylase